MLAANIKKRTDEILAGIKRNPVNLVDLYSHAQDHARSLRYDAGLAYLDGRVARSRELNREASRVLRPVPLAFR